MSTRILILSVISILLACGPILAGEEQLSPQAILAQQPRTSYIWPVKDTVEVTSVLCDNRRGHPHGGIDISLFGKVGVTPIVSVDDGVLMRIRDSNYGYGRALYIRMPGKMVAVYAHLDSFSPRLQKVADELRKKTGLKKLDYYYEEDDMDVVIRAGELIAYGGTTGTSVPHLHFEVRYDDLENLNPLTNGFPIDDKIAPVATAALFTPIDPQSRVNGGTNPSLVRIRNGAAQGVTTVSGRVGLALAAYDQNRIGGRRYAPYAMKVFVDGKEYFETRYERWGYIEQDIYYLQYDFDAKKNRYMRLYNSMPVDIPFYSKADAGTLQDLEPGRHEVRISVADAFGNADDAVMQIEVAPCKDKEYRHWPIGDGAYEFFNNKTVSVAEGAFALIGELYSLFEPVRVDITAIDSGVPEAVGKCYAVSDPGVTKRRMFTAAFKKPVEEPGKQYGVYLKNRNGMNFLGNGFNQHDGRIEGRGRSFGMFCLCLDDQPPSISQPHKKGNTSPTFSYVVRDNLAGLNAESVIASVDGKRALTDFNYRTGHAESEIYWDQAPGDYELEIRAVDNTGNEVVRKVPFTVK